MTVEEQKAACLAIRNKLGTVGDLLPQFTALRDKLIAAADNEQLEDAPKIADDLMAARAQLKAALNEADTLVAEFQNRGAD